MEFNMNQYKYNLIINSIIFNEHKQEKEVFDMLVREIVYDMGKLFLINQNIDAKTSAKIGMDERNFDEIIIMR